MACGLLARPLGNQLCRSAVPCIRDGDGGVLSHHACLLWCRPSMVLCGGFRFEDSRGFHAASNSRVVSTFFARRPERVAAMEMRFTLLTRVNRSPVLAADFLSPLGDGWEWFRGSHLSRVRFSFNRGGSSCSALVLRALSRQTASRPT